MDDREDVEEARRAGLSVTGTLGALDRAAEKGLVDLPSALLKCLIIFWRKIAGGKNKLPQVSTA
jgi:predicted nucleic acid-binding protein